MGENVEFVLSCQFPAVPAEAPRLKVVGELTPELVGKAAEIFGLTGEVREYEGDMWIRSGGISSRCLVRDTYYTLHGGISR